MAQVHVDSDALREFALALDQFIRGTRESLMQVASRLKEMGATSWQDANYQVFEEQFDQIQGGLLRTLEALETEQVPYLKALADRVDEIT